jgi:polyhydroxyalkanoate synthesis regulator phasin
VRSQRERAVQQAIAASHNEIQQLKETIAALRDNLEIARIEKENEIKKAVNRSNDEIAQLRGAISALREQIEALRAKT